MSPLEVFVALRLQLEAQLGREQATRAGALILLGQMALETDRFKAAMNYNFGGVKCSSNWRGCWQHFATREHLSEAEALRYLSDVPAGSKVERVGVDEKGRAILLFSGRHPVNKFRAFETLDDAVHHHVAFLLGARYRSAVHLAMAGRPDDYAIALRTAGYYTGDAASYARSVRLLAKEYDAKMPPDPEPVPAPERHEDEPVTLAASAAPAPAETPATPPQGAAVAAPPIAPLPQAGPVVARAEKPRPWWMRLLGWVIRLALTRRS